MQVPFFDLKRQYQQYRDRALAVAGQVFDSQMFIGGQQLEEVEKRIGQYCQAGHAVGVSSGTDALICALLASSIGQGDEVIIPAFTFVATASAVVRAGATPVFVDIDPEAYNIDPAKIQQCITSKTRAVIPVHLYGLPADMDPIMDLAGRNNLVVIEDAAQAIGAKYNGRSVGGIGDFGCLSFYPTKNLGAFGDGGMTVTNDPDAEAKLRMIRDHGQARRYESEIFGSNFRLDALQAAILNIKMDYLDRWTARRRETAALYSRLLGDCPGVRLPVERDNLKPVFNLYCIAVSDRNGLVEYLTSKGVGSAVYYPVPLHQQKCFAYLGHHQGDFPVAEQLSRQVLALPVWPELTESQVKYAAEAVLEFCRKK